MNDRTLSPLSLQFLWFLIKGTAADISRNNLALISAGVAFFIMLSLFPAMAALIALLSLIVDPVFVVAQLEDIRGLLPDDVYDILNTQIVGLITTQSETLGWAGVVSLFVALWSARAGVGAMMTGLNDVHDLSNSNTLRHYLRALALTIGLIIAGIIALLSVVIAPVLLAFFPLGPLGNFVAELVRWLLTALVVFGGVGALYRYGPNRTPVRKRMVSVGTLLVVISWAALSYGFSFYVANFGNYNQVYGSIGAVIAMLVWLWLSSFLVLSGAVINVQLEKLLGPGAAELV